MAKLYAIHKWNDLYENNRSRVVLDLNWVKITNKHDGENYAAIVAHAQGAIVFAGWILLIQVASKCRPRGVLIKENGTPHTPLSLSLKTRAPQEWFEIAIDYLESQTDWLDVQDVTGERHPTVIVPSPDCRRSDILQYNTIEYNREENGSELSVPVGEEKAHSGETITPPEWVRQWVENARANGSDYTNEDARLAFISLEANGWKYGQGDKRAALETQINFNRRHFRSTKKAKGPNL